MIEFAKHSAGRYESTDGEWFIKRVPSYAGHSRGWAVFRAIGDDDVEYVATRPLLSQAMNMAAQNHERTPQQ